MAGNWGAILAGLAGGASTMGESMDAREKQAEAKKRQEMADAIQMLQLRDQMGLTPVESGQTPESVMAGQAMAQLSQKGPSLQIGGRNVDGSSTVADDRQRDRQEFGAPSTVDIGGKQYAWNPAQGKEARAERRSEEAARRAALAAIARDESKGNIDFKRQMALKEYEIAHREPQMPFGAEEVAEGVYSVDKRTGKRGERLGSAKRTASDGTQDIIKTQRNQEGLAFLNDIQRRASMGDPDGERLNQQYQGLRVQYPNAEPGELGYSIKQNWKNSEGIDYTSARAAKASGGSGASTFESATNGTGGAKSRGAVPLANPSFPSPSRPKPAAEPVNMSYEEYQRQTRPFGG